MITYKRINIHHGSSIAPYIEYMDVSLALFIVEPQKDQMIWTS